MKLKKKCVRAQRLLWHDTPSLVDTRLAQTEEPMRCVEMQVRTLQRVFSDKIKICL